ncbi:GAP family protein [Corynebacterium sp. UBA2622]|uniref:GAP family protein n=1 Tax=Corynebacterium sp. UBA2622 TaxID=1946393 RepID=UPI0025C5684E|nr:GAP family protein [Corynebacterium sp. UBA2622]
MDVLGLAGLALVDSVSAGTLLIPAVLLLSWQRMRLAHYTAYLATITVSYFAIGVALMSGIRIAVDGAGGAAVTSSRSFWWVLLAAGVSLIALGILSPSPKRRAAEDILAARQRGGTASAGGLGAMVALAAGAAVAEAATMLPYLAAVGIIETFESGTAARLLALFAYCVVMIAPASVLGVAVQLSRGRVFRRVAAVLPRLEYETKVTALWIAVIVGIHLAVRSASHLGLIG